MHEIRISTSAEHELENIIFYSREHWGDLRATRTLNEFDRTFAQISVFPETGLFDENINVYKKAMIHVPFLILYKIRSEAKKVDVIQIIHMRRNK